MNNYLLIFIVSILASFPVIFIKKFTRTNKEYYLLFPVLLYFLLIVGYIYLLKNNKISEVYPIAKILSVLIIVFSGFLFFNEKLERKQYVGILLGLFSIYLLS